MDTDASSLRDTVLSAVKNDPLANAVRDVQVEPALDQDGEEFLRIELSLQQLNRDVDAQLEALLERIEEAIAAVDTRYASVRFLDAA
jgi:hypothetical protein